VAVATLLPLNAWASGHGVAVVEHPHGHVWYGPRVGPYWDFYWGPYWGPYWGSNWGPYWGPVYNTYPNTGEVKLDTKVKDAKVFINGAYAGTTHDNKTMHLRPGNYKIEIQEAGRAPYVQNVYVVAGKTVHLHPEQ
jgi:hypothetical protein